MQEISAGGVVYRRNHENMQILMIQDRYGKVTLPKGKIEAGETLEQTALREILEETGIRGDLQGDLEVIRYQYRHGNGETVDKAVHYYLVEAVQGDLKVQEEEIRSAVWLEPGQAWLRQASAGYRNNDSVLRKALERLGLDI